MGNKVAIAGYRVSLKEIKYSDNISGVINYNVNVIEDVSLEKYDNDSFSLLASRDIQFEPNDRNIFLSVSIKYYLDKENTATVFLENPSEMEKYLNETKLDFYKQTNAGTQLSLILAQITSWFGGNPLLLPPTIEKIEE